MIRLAIADDHAYFRLGLKAVIAQALDMQVEVECSRGEELLSIPELNSQVDVVILDVKTSGMEGWDVCSLLAERYPAMRILVLSMYDSEMVIHKMVRSGATAYLLKDVEPGEMLTAIRCIHSSGVYFNASLSVDKLRAYLMKSDTAASESLLQSPPLHQSSPLQDRSSHGRLTPREREVLAYLCEQLTDAEIAERVHLSTSTVHGYRIRLLEKTGSKNVVGLVLYALKHNVVGRPIME